MMKNKVLKEYENAKFAFIVFDTSDLIVTSLEDEGQNDFPWEE